MNNNNKIQKKYVFIVSDATGDTASLVLNAAMRQFDKKYVRIKFFRKISTPAQIERVLDDAEKRSAMIFFTFVLESNRVFIKNLARTKHVLCIDILGEPIMALSEHLNMPPMLEQTLGKRTGDEYFSRIDAIDFFLTHDDGARTEDAIIADVIIIGVSRSGKSPLSLYLAQKGYKVMNIPYIKGIDLPEIIGDIDRKKIIGLIIRPEILYEIRKKRLKKSKYPRSDYVDLEHIHEELDDIRKFFRKNKIKKVIDITSRAIEEAASEIIEYLELLAEENDY